MNLRLIAQLYTLQKHISMFDGFKTVLTNLVPSLTDDEWATIKRLASPTHLAAGEPLVNEGRVGCRIAYVHKGAFVYFTLHDGHKNVIAFDFEGDIAGDFHSFFEAAPAVKTVAALEDSDVLTLTYEQFEALAERNPEFKQIRATVASQLFEGVQARALEMQQYSAEERYRRLLRRSPHVIQRIPLYMVASYIGVTPEALSRIRRRLVR